MSKRVLIAVGGTGGHVYPARAVAEGLLAGDGRVEVLFAGGGLSKNRYFDQATLPYQEIHHGTLAKKNPFAFLRNAGNIGRGVLQSLRILETYQPDLVLCFGAYHSFPVAMATRLSSQPTVLVLFEPNAYPGRVNAFFSRYAHTTCICFPEAASYLRGETVEVKMPLRSDFKLGKVTVKEAREFFGLEPNLTTILVFGGSQGAAAINRLVKEAVPILAKTGLPRFQILHFTGNINEAQAANALYHELNIPACVKDFESRMDMAFAAADLCVGRAGASAVAEQLEFLVPGVLIPYPYATDKHQDRNAEFLSIRVRCAVQCTESQLTPKRLADVLYKLMDRDNALLKEMKQAMQQHKRHMQRPDLASVILEILDQRDG